ncbi:vitellogenin-like isoform X3 [Megachile rotundata]|uniref:vitellogenin-like isoform X3 n=1 Tax=Megachile rotundata TaxID=143995 RepID=UPI003FD52BA8
MWLPLTLLVLAGVVSAESNYGWKVGNEYSYVVQSRTFTTLDEFPEEYAGIMMRGYLTVQAKDEGKLTAKLTKGHYAHVNGYLPMGWDEDIPNQQLVPHDIPISEKPFDIKLMDGVIDSVIVEEDVPNWEVVLLKSIISQFQVDIKGNKIVEGHDVKVPDENDPRGGFTVLEDYFAGLNEVRYDFKPLSEQQFRTRPELVPKPELKGSGQHIDIVKTKRYDRYPEMLEKVLSMTRQMKKEPKTNKNLMSKSSISRIVISGSLKDFVVQSAVSTSKMTITPSFNDAQNSTVLSKLSLTLEDMHEIKTPMPSPTKPKSTGYRISFETTPSSLEDPPKHPVWPNIIDYGGKFIRHFREFNGLAAVRDLLHRISNELVDPNTIPEQQTLDKFTHLVNIIRTMNRNQIAEAENKLQISPKKLKWGDKADAIRQNRWFVFRDAITQAGTGPALLTIKNWVENGELRSAEAAEMLSKIPASARQITHQYTEAFFELATNPQVTQTALLNVTAITAFSELLFLSQGNDKSIYKFYPVHTTSRPSDEQYSDIVNKYIPYLGVQLKKAVDDDDSARIQTYIVALGTIGMYEVLPVFEPFLTGREKMTAFQKTLILASLSNFVANHPKKALPGLKQIYMNTTESQEVRCMAVFLIPMTNPPLEVLREIVQFSNNESSKQVKSAVKSTLHSLEYLPDPEWQSLAKNARAALKLLDSKDYDLLKSHEFIFNKMKEGNLVTDTLLNYIGSDNSPIPRTIYLASILYDGDFKGSPVELMTMIPNMESLIDALIPSDKRSLVKTATEKIAEELNIVGDRPVLLEGNFLWRTKFLSRFIPYDKNTVRNLPNKIVEHLTARKDGAFHNTHILNLHEMMIGDTTDTGLPFVYSLRECTLHKLSSTDNYKTGRFESDFQFATVQKTQRNIGFVTPFDHRYFVAGVDKHTQVYLPLKVSVEVSAPKKSVQLKIWPPKSDKPNTVLQCVRTPYTSIHNVMDLQPLLEESSFDTRRLYNFEVRRDSQPIPDTIFRMEVEASENAWDKDVVGNCLWTMFTMQDEQSEYHRVAVIVDERPDEGEPLVLSASYGTLDVEAGTEDASQWTHFVNATEAFSENRDSEQRKMRFLEEAAKGIVLAQAGVLDFHVHIPLTKEEVKINLTTAWSASNAETKGRFLSHLTIMNQIDEVEFEVCAASQLALTPSYFPVYDEVNNSTPKIEFDIDLRHGENCQGDNRVNIMGTGTRSNELKEDINDISVVKECKKQMEQGNKLLRACQKAGDKALQVDELQLSLQSGCRRTQRDMEYFFSGLFSSGIIVRTVADLQPKVIDEGKINLTAKISKNMKSANFSVQSPNINMQMNDVNLDYFEDSSEEKEDEVDNSWLMDDDVSTCVMDLNRAETFDGKEFPLELSSCWQVLMTTYPKLNPKKPSEQLAMSEDESVSILAREINGQKEVKVILGQNEILLLPGSELPEVLVNGQKVPVSGTVTHQVRQDDEVVFEIFQRGSHYISVVSEEYDVTLTYDGKRLMIEESEMFSYSLRGLCGNYDGDSENDFTSPGNCLLTKPEEFIASYTLTKEQCEGESLQKVKSLQKPACATISRR